jgi:pimeloyl-ACP methyl ester carboxylesterase
MAHCDTRPGIGSVIGREHTVFSVTLRLVWNRAGSGEPLLLVHGIGTTHVDFAALRPCLEAQYDVLAPDLPGHAESPPLSTRPTIGAIADALEADLDTLGLGRVHVLGSSIGARVALELAIRGRARSVVAIAPSGLGLPAERVYQGAVMSTARLLMRTIRPLIATAAQFPFGRALLLTNLRSAPWLSSEAEARALRDGFADSPDFWQQLLWAVLMDVPLGLRKIECPVILAQGTVDVMSTPQSLRYLSMVPGSRLQPVFGGGHAPHSDAPRAIVRLVREATAPPERPASGAGGRAPRAAAGTGDPA